MHAALESRTNEIYQHLVAGDESACRRYIDRIRSEDGVSVLTVCEQLTEAFHLIGDAWACSEIGVYREHVASQIGCRLLLDLSSSLPAVSDTAPKAIGCTPESDPYSLPTLMVELVARSRMECKISRDESPIGVPRSRDGRSAAESLLGERLVR